MPQALSLLIGALSVVALVLSVVGIYGVMAHYVQQIAKDISIRLALGGAPGSVLRLIVGRGLLLVGAGVAAGIVMAYAAARLHVEPLLRRQPRATRLTFAGVVALLARRGAAGLLGAGGARRSRSNRRPCSGTTDQDGCISVARRWPGDFWRVDSVISCPHAARMSRPRDLRTETVSPRSATICANRFTRASDGRS